MSGELFESVRLKEDGTAVILLDQTALPNDIRFVELRRDDEFYNAIAMLKVRGAPAIGIFAAFALFVSCRGSHDKEREAFFAALEGFSARLCSARPTAANLKKQLDRMVKIAHSLDGTPTPHILGAMREEALAIQREEKETCRIISENGLELIRDGFGILTHCNAGPIATAGYGTGLGPILLAHERGLHLSIYCDETRPLMQGARLTVFELMRAGLDCTLICDNMASSLMKDGKIDAVFTGCDRVARNGDTANKIGTNGLAVLARHYNIPFYIFCPTSTLDPECATGADIEIEQRPASEITHMFFDKPVAPPGVKCYNPAFDVTDNSLITAIITENGVHRTPYDF